MFVQKNKLAKQEAYYTNKIDDKPLLVHKKK